MPNQAPLAEVHLTAPLRRKDLQFDARTDLTAVITDAGNVEIYRFGGQQAFCIETDDLSGKPTCLSWARRGELLLVGTDTGIVDLFYTRTGKVNLGLERVSERDGDLTVTGIGTHSWTFGGKNDLGIGTGRGTSTSVGDPDTEVEEWFEQINIGADISPSKGALNMLPYALAKVNPGDVLPRLSPIPPPSKAGPGMPSPVLRSSQKDLHLLLNNRLSHSPEGVEVTFISVRNGDIDSSIGELFHRTFKCKNSTDEQSDLRHCTDNHCGLHAILQGDQCLNDEAHERIQDLSLKLFDVPFASSGSVHTATILANATQLKLLELYISQTIETAVLDWSTLTSLPKRFIANINETLEEKQEGLLDQHLYQLLLTGHCSDTVIEWLREELAERGHKRWDHAMTTFYHALTQLFQVNLLPALEKCALAASTLRGLATYYEGSKNFDVASTFFTKIIEAVGCIQLLTHEALQIANREEHQFRAFSSWLRNQIDVAAAEPGSTAAADLAEREAMSTDVPKILSYLEGPFTSSALQPLVGRKLQPVDISSRLAALELSSETTGIAILGSRQRKDVVQDTLYIPIHLANIQKQIKACSEQMKRWQSTTWLPPQEIPIQLSGTFSTFDVNMRATTDDGASRSVTTIAALDPASPSIIMVHTVDCKSGLRSSVNKPAEQHSWTIEMLGVEFSDLRMLPDQSLVVLAAVEDCTRLLHLPSSVVSSAEDTILTNDDADRFTFHVFAEGRFEPAYIYVSDHARRRNVLVLDKACQRWQVYRIPTAAVKGDAGLDDGYQDDPEDSEVGMMVD